VEEDMMDDKALKTYTDFKIRQNIQRAETPEPTFLKAVRSFAAGRRGQNLLIGAAIMTMTYLTFHEQINEAVASVGTSIGRTIDKMGQGFHQAAAEVDRMIPKPVPR
jgi:hypothetical protein